jgi:type IV pilus biogenesis protein CpaD/CtpE
MKIRFAVLAALVAASAVACAQSPTATKPARRDTTPSTYNADGSDTTSRSGTLGTGH